MKTTALIKLNRLFPPVAHPFNTENEGGRRYSMWEYERGEDTLKRYSPEYSVDQMIKEKNVLDIGAGAGGKSVYYLTRGAASVTAIDIIPEYKHEAEKLAKKKNVSDRFTYIVCDAAKLPFDNDSFDTVIMNDAMEHLAEPESVLDEIYRVLKMHGKLYLNFPPYSHPYGAHLSDTIAIPWVHLFFDQDTLISAYKELVSVLPDAESRLRLRISADQNGHEYFSYINKMTVKRFNRISKSCKLTLVYYREIPLRPYLFPLARLPLTKEAFIRCIVSVFEKQ